MPLYARQRLHLVHTTARLCWRVSTSAFDFGVQNKLVPLAAERSPPPAAPTASQSRTSVGQKMVQTRSTTGQTQWNTRLFPLRKTSRMNSKLGPKPSNPRGRKRLVSTSAIASSPASPVRAIDAEQTDWTACQATGSSLTGSHQARTASPMTAPPTHDRHSLSFFNPNTARANHLRPQHVAECLSFGSTPCPSRPCLAQASKKV